MVSFRECFEMLLWLLLLSNSITIVVGPGNYCSSSVHERCLSRFCFNFSEEIFFYSCKRSSKPL